MWEQDEKLAPEDKLNTLACLNMKCCKEVISHTTMTAKVQACLINLLCAIAFVCACNALMLSRRPFKLFILRIYGDIFMITFVAILVAIIVVVAYKYVPTQQFETQTLITQYQTFLTQFR